MSNGTLSNDSSKCETCKNGKDQFYDNGELYLKAFDVSMCGDCIHNSTAEDNYEGDHDTRNVHEIST